MSKKTFTDQYLISFWFSIEPSIRRYVAPFLKGANLPDGSVDDVIQELALVFFCGKPPRKRSFPERYQEHLWRGHLFRAAHNLARDVGRKRGNQSLVRQNMDAVIKHEPSVPGHAQQVLDADLVHRALNALTAKEQQLLRARIFEGYTIAEVAAMLQTSEYAAEQQYLRALKRALHYLMNDTAPSTQSSLSLSTPKK